MKNIFKIHQIMNLLRIKTPKVIKIIGTNGKGTTGDYLAQMASRLDFAQLGKNNLAFNSGAEFDNDFQNLILRFGSSCGRFLDENLRQKAAQKYAKNDLICEILQENFSGFFARKASEFGWQNLTPPDGFCSNLPHFSSFAHGAAAPQNRAQPLSAAAFCERANAQMAAAPQNRPAKIAHFCSPHLFSVYERFRASYLSQEQIAARCDLAALYLLRSLKRANAHAIGVLGWFELCTLMVALVFADADIIVAEAGIGARFDSTAAFDAAAAVICQLSFDHAEVFDNLSQIICDKCSPQALLICAQDNDFLAYKRALGAQICVLNAGENLLPNDPLCEDKAWYLQQNFALAKLAFRQIFGAAYSQARLRTHLGARAQKVNGVLIDAAHNEAAAAAFARSWGAKKHVFLALNSRKQNAQIIAALAPFALDFTPLNECAQRALAAAGARILPLELALSAAKAAPDKFVGCGSFDAARILPTILGCCGA